MDKIFSFRHWRQLGDSPKNIYLYRRLSNLPATLIPGTFTLESRKKNDSALSAALWTIYRLYRVLCEVYTIWWVNFRLFSNFTHLHVVCRSPGYKWGNAKFLKFWFLSFLSKLLVFCEPKSKKAIHSWKRVNRSHCSLVKSDGHSFVMSNGSDLPLGIKRGKLKTVK